MELFLFYAALFLLGAAHAMEPGHGKLLVTSYLTGTQAKIQDAFVLGGLVALFHTLSVAILGFTVFALALILFKDAFLHYLEIFSGVVILGLGCVLFWRRFIQKTPHEDQCDCHLDHAHQAHDEVKVDATRKSSFKEVVMLALASGMTPCPMALTALIAAFAMGQALAALGALTIFSAGIGGVLVVLGVVLIRGTGHLQEKWERFKNAPVVIGRISTVMVLMLGCYLVAKPLFFHEEHQEHESINFLMPASFSQATGH